MNDKPFFDTNVILYAFRYAFRQDDRRGQVAETLLAAGGALSVQVLNEFVAVARRTLHKSWDEVRRALDIPRVFCPKPVPLMVETHERAVHIAERYCTRRTCKMARRSTGLPFAIHFRARGMRQAKRIASRARLNSR
jgi:predicted nucleic acid-binding protein